MPQRADQDIGKPQDVKYRGCGDVLFDDVNSSKAAHAPPHRKRTHRILDLVSSIKLTIVCLSAAMVLVFVGTLAQERFGNAFVQEWFFKSTLVWWPLGNQGFRIPIFPGGHLLGAILVVNLFAAQVHRFRWEWRAMGLHLIHTGVILILLGGLLTDLLSVESQMQIAQGETKTYSEDTRRMEWITMDQKSSGVGHVTAFPTAYLRPVRYEKPYRITLQKFTREYYPGTEIPKAFSSHITLSDPTRGVNRDVVISMNHPFRYDGETFYQVGFGRDGLSSILLVVSNPGFAAPYLACAALCLGLLIQFSIQISGYMQRTAALTK